ncbi:MAG: hypothetical protein HYX43_08065 [Burkholderiales bacterium]|nr:hypothetical protein [Burkholderiales bacterium]
MKSAKFKTGSGLTGEPQMNQSRFAGHCTTRAAGVVAALLASTLPAQAAELSDRVSINGYGHAGYFKSSVIDSGEATVDGNWDGLTSLLFTAKLDNRSSLRMQLHNTSERSRLDWAFVDFELSPKLMVRAGQIKLPLGLYTEIIDVSFLRQSTLQPLIYQEPAGLVYESFRGADAAYTVDLGSSNLTLKAYVGQIVGEADSSVAHKRMAGFQATYNTPIDGLRLMASGYRAKLDIGDSNLPAFGLGNKTTTVLSADFNNGTWDVKAESANSTTLGVKSTGSYLQVAYTFADRWTPFVRFDRATLNRNTAHERNQKTSAVGLSYKVNDGVSLRLEGLSHRGVALPYSEWLGSSPGAALDSSTAPVASSWKTYGLSLNFIF